DVDGDANMTKAASAHAARPALVFKAVLLQRRRTSYGPPRARHPRQNSTFPDGAAVPTLPMVPRPKQKKAFPPGERLGPLLGPVFVPFLPLSRRRDACLFGRF